MLADTWTPKWCFFILFCRLGAVTANMCWHGNKWLYKPYFNFPFCTFEICVIPTVIWTLGRSLSVWICDLPGFCSHMSRRGNNGSCKTHFTISFCTFGIFVMISYIWTLLWCFSVSFCGFSYVSERFGCCDDQWSCKSHFIFVFSTSGTCHMLTFTRSVKGAIFFLFVLIVAFMRTLVSKIICGHEPIILFSMLCFRDLSSNQ